MGLRPLRPGGRRGVGEEGPEVPQPPGRDDRKADLHAAGRDGERGKGRSAVV